jgi:hypothetical protein
MIVLKKAQFVSSYTMIAGLFCFFSAITATFVIKRAGRLTGLSIWGKTVTICGFCSSPDEINSMYEKKRLPLLFAHTYGLRAQKVISRVAEGPV